MSHLQSDAISDAKSLAGVEQFLYMDPETGMVVCMIADGDGFKPASASQEMDGLPVHWTGNSWALDVVDQRCYPEGYEPVEDSSLDSLDSFVKNFEHAFLGPNAG